MVRTRRIHPDVLTGGLVTLLCAATWVPVALIQRERVEQLRGSATFRPAPGYRIVAPVSAP